MTTKNSKLTQARLLPERDVTFEMKKKQPTPASVWANLSFRGKLLVVMLICALLPSLIITQSLLTSTYSYSQSQLDQNIRRGLEFFQTELDARLKQVDAVANRIAAVNQAAGIDPNDTAQVKAQQPLLEPLLTNALAESNASFVLIVDLYGRTVAQKIQVVDADFNAYPLLLDAQPKTKLRWRPVNVRLLTDVSAMPIIKDVLERGKPMRGYELLKASMLKRLGLDAQARIGIRAQQTQGLSEAKQPAPEGAFDIDNGQAGLTVVSVHPIRLGNRVVGAAVTGQLLNRNFTLVDELTKRTDIPTATLFAYDWRVSTNVPYADTETRAIGTRAASEVSRRVLQEGEEFLGQTNIIGSPYRTGYRPIYDHTRPFAQSRPIGMLYVGQSLSDFEKIFQGIRNTGYLITAVAMGLVVLLALWLATSLAAPLTKLARFAQAISTGRYGTRLLEELERQDEIGILGRELNTMAISIEQSLASTRREIGLQEAEKRYAEQERQQQQLLLMLDEVEGAVRGDLTVRASIAEGDVGIIADFFNAIIASLRKTVLQVKSTSTQLNDSLSSNEVTIRQLASEANQQADEIAHTLIAVERMSATIQEVSRSAGDTASIARSASNTALQGGQAMERTVKSILRLRETVAETAKKVKRLGESSQRISRVVSLINQIAMQTNLLAINASVEAARAGAEGRGFAVVAEEIGALANRSAAATVEIEQIVENIQRETSEVVDAMENGTMQVVEGSRLVDEVRGSLEQIVNVSQQIDVLVERISTNTISQAETSQTVAALMGQVTLLSRRTSKMSEDVCDAILQTVGVAHQLSESVAVFKAE